ncbi:Ras GTPase activating protein ira2 [Tritrichomonas musculus]|uniref:Ras GTPase activating protein ira2 n=1 Tax=Tritrichomonas musculus TaxID=1915356 RepID=A0ABR2L3J9_9EUKA
MIPDSVYCFNNANLPMISDSSALSKFLIDNYYTEEEFSAIFADLKEGKIPEVEFNDRSMMLAEALPINFYNHLTLEKGNLGTNLFFTPSQKFVMKYVQKTLLEMKDNESYCLLLKYFADRMTSQYSINSKLFKFCGEITIRRSKKIGIYTKDDQIEVYSKNSLLNCSHVFPPEKLHRQSKEWEQTQLELDNGLFSPLIAVFRSFSALTSWETLPFEAYSGFINYITAPDLIVASQLLNQNIDDIDIPLMTIFKHKNLHRRLLKYCIYDDVFSTEDTSLLMRRNSKEARIVVDFLTSQIQPLIEPTLNSIKVKICECFDRFNDQNEFNCFQEIVKIFIENFVKILPIIPSSVRYVCNVINEASELKFKNNGYKGVFMAFFFRVIFPIFCQPRQTDPSDIRVDIKKMASFGKIMTYVFVGEQGASLAQFAEIAEVERENVSSIFGHLICCPEKFDVIDCPSFKAACQMIDQIRKKCQGKTDVLIYDYRKPSQILIHWLDSLVKN